MEHKMKERLDVLLVKRGLCASREKAKAMIMAGAVYVSGQKEDKAGTMFGEDVPIEVRGEKPRYVSRGGLKLEKAMQTWPISLTGETCMDVGASTGGFTDCMLQNGAVKVYAVDVGRGQLDWSLRNDPRVVCMEKTNIRYLTPDQIEEKPAFISIDVSFISLTLVLPPAGKLMANWGRHDFTHIPDFDKTMDFAARLHETFEEIKPFLTCGRMIRCPAFSCPTVTFPVNGAPEAFPAVYASAWEADGRKIALFVNHTDAPAPIRLSDGRTYTVSARNALTVEM